MSKKSIKWGILGTSYISHVMAKAILKSARSELYAVGSRSQQKATQFAEQFSIPHVYDDYQALLADNNIDAVYIGLPNHLHKEWVIRSAQAKKHILCEKPFVISAEEALAAIAAVNEAKVVCMEALMYRCHPFTKKLQEIIQSECLGEIKLYHATYAAHIVDVANPTAGGCIRNLGCYPISLIRLLANAEPVELQAMGRMGTQRNDHQASVLLKFANQAMAVVSTADDMKMVWQFDVYGTEGHLKVTTNPWMPDMDNRLVIYKNGEQQGQEITLTAEKSLYTYQIDTMNHHILDEDVSNYEKISLQDSLGNITVLEKWLQQI